MSVKSEEGTNSGARMLERRVSNNRADLSGDQRMNYFLAWFNQWSELQKKDFVKVLAEKMTGGGSMINGNMTDEFDSLNINGEGENVKKPPSLFSCQVKLFREWFSGWSDDQKNYLVMRLQAIDGEFYGKYEKYVSDPEAAKGSEKDYFEPGVPPEMVRKSSRSVLGPHSISPTPPAVGYTSNNFSGTSSIESARPATIDEKVDSAEEDDKSYISGDQSLEESKGQNNYFKEQNTDDDTTETNKLSEADYQKQLSTIVE